MSIEAKTKVTPQWKCERCGYSIESDIQPLLCYGCRALTRFTAFIPDVALAETITEMNKEKGKGE